MALLNLATFRLGQRLRRGLTGAAAAVAVMPALSANAADGMIYDAVTGCGTSNPFPAEGETIRWYGACQNGMLSGYGTLIWYQNGAETQRNEGMFWGGEMHGPTTTTYPDRTQIIGTYNVGRRSGQFMTFRADGSHTVSVFNDGTLMSERVVPSQQALPTARPMFATPPAPAPRPVSAVRAAAPQQHATVATPVFSRTTATRSGVRPFQARRRPVTNAFAGDSTFGTVVISSAGVSIGDTAPGFRAPVRTASVGLPDTPRFARPNPARTAISQPEPMPSPTTVARLIPRNAPRNTPRYASAAQYNSPPRAAPVARTQGAHILTPEQRFVQAFAAEQAGRTAQAAAAYSELAAQYPYTESASLAGERLAMLTVATPVAARARPAAPATPEPATSMNGKYVCTVPGLFDNGSKWCGVVRNANPAYLSVEVKQVNAAGIFNIGFTRAPCTGNTFINYFSRGIRVSVPRNCMGPVW